MMPPLSSLVAPVHGILRCLFRIVDIQVDFVEIMQRKLNNQHHVYWWYSTERCLEIGKHSDGKFVPYLFSCNQYY